MRISDWSSDVCSSDLKIAQTGNWPKQDHPYKNSPQNKLTQGTGRRAKAGPGRRPALGERAAPAASTGSEGRASPHILRPGKADRRLALPRSEEHTSELQSLMRISYAVFCLKQKTNN